MDAAIKKYFLSLLKMRVHLLVGHNGDCSVRTTYFLQDDLHPPNADHQSRQRWSVATVYIGYIKAESLPYINQSDVQSDDINS